MISDQIAVHSVQLPLLILDLETMFSTRIVTVHAFLHNNKLLNPNVFSFARILQEQDALLCKHTFTYASLTLK